MDFGEWLARCAGEETEAGGFARYAASDPYAPTPAGDRGRYMMWLTYHPDTVRDGERFEHPQLKAFESAWDRYVLEMRDDAGTPGPLPTVVVTASRPVAP
ncbi:hypothetical protein ABT278_29440 [Streptomyces sp. NPDC001228]|uniref:hypothetical protein n=1 Tax=Streptomyces sp. NPDC001228 TaxID=3154381 RepID=UPI00331C57C0